MAQASLLREQNPANYQNHALTLPYHKLVDMFGAPVTHHNVQENHPVTFKSLVDLYDKTQTLRLNDRIMAYINRWGNTWHPIVLRLTEHNDINDIVDDWVEFEPELPARLAEFVTAPLIDHTSTQKVAKFLMYGLAAMFEWGSLAVPRGVEFYEKSLVSIASDIVLLFKLLTHSALWRARMEVKAIMQLVGLPYLNGWFQERLQQPGYEFGVLHAKPYGIVYLASVVENTMTETTNTNYSMIVLNQRLKALLAIGDPSRQEAFRDPQALASFKAQGYDAVKGVLDKPIYFEQDYVYRGRTEAPDEPMTVPYRAGWFLVSSNAYLSGWSETPYFMHASAGHANTVLAPPNTSDFRNIEFLDLSRGDAEWNTMNIVDLIQNCLCYDQTDPMLPLRERLYADIASNWQDHKGKMGFHLPAGANKGETQISPFIYQDRLGNARIVRMWGQQSRVYQSEAFLNAAVRVARQRVVQAIGGEDKIIAIKRMSDILENAYAKNASMPIDKAAANSWYFEAFVFAVAQHYKNAAPGNWILKANEFGVVDLPPLGAGLKIGYKTDAATTRFVVVDLQAGNAADLITFASAANAAGGNVAWQSSGIPHGFCTIGHAQTLLSARRSGQLGQWANVENFGAQLDIIEEGLEALNLYVDKIVDFFGVKLSADKQESMNPNARQRFENLFLSAAVVPLYLRADDRLYANIARRSNLLSGIYEGTWCGVNRAPLFLDVASFAGSNVAAYPEAGVFLSNPNTGVALARAAGVSPDPVGADLYAWMALAYALDENLTENPGLADMRVGFAGLKDKWAKDVTKDASLGKPGVPATWETFAGWLRNAVEEKILAKATLKEADIGAALVAYNGIAGGAGVQAVAPDPAPMAALAVEPTIKEMQTNAEILAKTVNGLYRILVVENPGPQIGRKKTLTRALLESLPNQYFSPSVRGTMAYRNLAAGQPGAGTTPSGYVNTRLSVSPLYFVMAKENPDAANANPLRPADPHKDNMRPLAPNRSKPQAVASLATLAHGAADNSLVYTFTGPAAAARSKRTPALSDRQPDYQPLSEKQGTLAYDENDGLALPSYFQWETITEIAESPEMINRLKRASAYPDQLSRSLAFLFIGQPVYGKKQIEWAELNLPVFPGFIAIAHNIQFEMHSAYFLNPAIGNIFYGFQESAISCDMLHWKMTVQVRFFCTTYIQNENSFTIAPHVAFRRFKGGVDKSFVTRVKYGRTEPEVDFDITHPFQCRKSFFVLPMGPSQTEKDLADVVSLVPRNRDTSEMRQHYATGEMVQSTKSKEPTFPSAFEFNLLTEFYRVGNQPRENRMQYSVLKAMSNVVNDMAYKGPQRIKSPEDGKRYLSRGAGPFKYFDEGIRPSLMGGPQIFPNSTRPLGSIVTMPPGVHAY